MTPIAALNQLLRGTGLEAKPAGRCVFRIIATQQPRLTIALPIQQSADIVVTGRKQVENLATVPAALSVYAPSVDRTRDAAASGTREVAASIPGLSITNTGPGANRLFIRGVADSPFAGFNQSTVAVLLDDSRINYDAPDPDLRLVDVDRVEVLEGPQGPLYGTGALGGVYRVVPNGPDLIRSSGSIGVTLNGIEQAGIGGDVQAVVNLPVARDYLAIRAVGYQATTPGWISDIGLRNHANAARIAGGRLTARAAPGGGWTIDLGGVAQSINVEDSQYVDRDIEHLARRVAIAEPRSTDFTMVFQHTKGAIGTVTVDASSSVSWHDIDSRYDASASAAAFGIAAPAAYDEARRYSVFDQEVRANGALGPRLSWLVGISYLSAASAVTGTIAPLGETGRPVLDLRRTISEAAAFAQATYALGGGVKAEFGARVYDNVADDELTDRSAMGSGHLRFVGFSPSVAVSWQPSDGRLIYLRYGSAIRPGGLKATGDGRYDADTLDSIELGSRMVFAGGRIRLDGSTFAGTWREVQSDYLLPDGLIASHNVGDARLVGGELSLHWRIQAGWRVSFSGIAQHARLVSTTTGARLPEDTRLPVVPDIAGTLTTTHEFPLFGWRAAARGSVRVTGPTRLSFDSGLDRHTPAFAELRAGLSASHGAVTAHLTVDNLANARADTFAFGNPFAIRSTSQFTPLQPRTVSAGLVLAF